MASVQDGKGKAPKQGGQVRWLRLAVTILGAIILSFGFAYLLQISVARLNLPLYDVEWLAYLIVFGISVLANLSIMAPVPFAVSVMIAAATKWDPVLIALVGSIGGSLGELSGYYAGYMGKRIAIPGEAFWYKRVESWIRRWGMLAIFFIALQPIIPIDVGGFVAGAARMPVRKFLPALWLGKFPKYLILTYGGAKLVELLPFLFRGG